MATAVERAFPPSTPREVGEWVESVAEVTLQRRAASVARMEQEGTDEQSQAMTMPAVTAPLLVPARSPRRRWRVMFVVVPALGAATMLGAFLIRSRAANVSAAAAAPADAGAIEPTTPTPDESPSSALPLATPSAPEVHRVHAPRKPPLPAKPAGSCSPPFTVDPRGVKLPKPGCI